MAWSMSSAAALTFSVAIPTAVKIYNWVVTRKKAQHADPAIGAAAYAGAQLAPPATRSAVARARAARYLRLRRHSHPCARRLQHRRQLPRRLAALGVKEEVARVLVEGPQ